MKITIKTGITALVLPRRSPSTRYMILAHIRSRGPFTHTGPSKFKGPLQCSLTLILMETEFIASIRS